MYLHNSMRAYLVDSNNMSFLDDFSRTSGQFDNCDAFGIRLIHSTQILQALACRSVWIHTSQNNEDGPSFSAEAGGARYGAPSASWRCLCLDRVKTLGFPEVGATGVG